MALRSPRTTPILPFYTVKIGMSETKFTFEFLDYIRMAHLGLNLRAHLLYSLNYSG